MPNPFVAIAGASVVGGLFSSRSASRAARAQERASDAAIAEQARQFDLAYEAQQPYRQVGTAALNELAALYGLPQSSNEKPLSFEEWAAQQGELLQPNTHGGLRGAFDYLTRNAALRSRYEQYAQDFQPSQQTAAAPNYENFFASPDYQFALRQGQQSVENSAAARGGLYSGNALRAITDYGQGMASQQLNTYANRLAGIAGVGQVAATNTGANATAYGNNVSNLLVGQGNARASGIINQGNAWANTGNQLAMLYGMGAFGGGGGLSAGWGSGANLNNAWASQWMGP